MSTVPDNEFDLEKLFLPAWAQEEPSASKYAKYEGIEERADPRGDRRGPRRGGPGREGGGPRGQNRRPPGPGRPPGRPEGPRRGSPRERGDRRGPRPDLREPREPLPLPEVTLNLVPEEKGVESLARQIKMAGRAYPLFDIAHMILQKPERYTAAFGTKKMPKERPSNRCFSAHSMKPSGSPRMRLSVTYSTSTSTHSTRRIGPLPSRRRANTLSLLNVA